MAFIGPEAGGLFSTSSTIVGTQTFMGVWRPFNRAPLVGGGRSPVGVAPLPQLTHQSTRFPPQNPGFPRNPSLAPLAFSSQCAGPRAPARQMKVVFYCALSGGKRS